MTVSRVAITPYNTTGNIHTPYKYL